MKEKIENLIKEVGINEVESILNQMKSKVDVKENLKQDFIELLTGCTISFDGDYIDYKKDGKLLFYYHKNYNIFRINYNIWSNFESKFNLNHQELRDLLVGVEEEVLNYKDVTPELNPIHTENLNYKDVTPFGVPCELLNEWKKY